LERLRGTSPLTTACDSCKKAFSPCAPKEVNLVDNCYKFNPVARSDCENFVKSKRPVSTLVATFKAALSCVVASKADLNSVVKGVMAPLTLELVLKLFNVFFNSYNCILA
jgi:hypothetical protein